MASSPKTPAEQLAEKLLPGWKAVRPDDPPPAPGPDEDDTARADRTLLSIGELRARSPAPRAPAATAAGPPGTAPAPDDTEIVRLENGPLRKTVAVSPSAGKVLWSQG